MQRSVSQNRNGKPLIGDCCVSFWDHFVRHGDSNHRRHTVAVGEHFVAGQCLDRPGFHRFRHDDWCRNWILCCRCRRHSRHAGYLPLLWGRQCGSPLSGRSFRRCARRFTTEEERHSCESSVEQADEQPNRVGPCAENSSEGLLIPGTC